MSACQKPFTPQSHGRCQGVERPAVLKFPLGAELSLWKNHAARIGAKARGARQRPQISACERQGDAVHPRHDPDAAGDSRGVALAVTGVWTGPNPPRMEPAAGNPGPTQMSAGTPAGPALQSQVTSS